MTKIEIEEGGVDRGAVRPQHKSSSPARREAGVADLAGSGQQQDQASDKNREGVSNESGYFEDEESEDSLQQEDSIEIIFDKNASNNNTGSKTEGRNT